jgi:Uncharacterized conserved protein
MKQEGMTNTFFKLAMAQATRLAGKPGRLLQLVSQLLYRLYRMEGKQTMVNDLQERLKVLGRMVTSFARGRYRNIPLKTLLSVIAAILYFLNPFDLIPDAIVGIGFTDDLAVLTWVYKTSEQELNKFIAWEKEQFPLQTPS